jgi:hypothetical protein
LDVCLLMLFDKIVIISARWDDGQRIVWGTHVSIVDFIVHNKIIFYFILFYCTQFDPLWELNVQKTTQGMVGGTRNHNNFWYLSIWYKSIQIGLNRT